MTVTYRVTAIYRAVTYRFDCIFKFCCARHDDKLTGDGKRALVSFFSVEFFEGS